MALVKVDDKAVVVRTQDNARRTGPKKKVLDEEKYTEDMEKIIERDFFPDMEKLRAQREYIDAMESNDTEKMRELAIRFGSTRPKRPNTASTLGQGSAFVDASPATFETPAMDEGRRSSPKRHRESDIFHDEDDTSEEVTNKKKKRDDSELSLDEYLAHNTSEDNASFVEIMQVAEDKEKQKHAWMYDVEKTQQEEQTKMLEGTNLLAIKGEPKPVKTWTYQTKNALMYVPEGVDDSIDEKINKEKPRQIVHENTRFLVNPFNLEQQKDTMARAAVAKAVISKGKIGPDGKELLADDTPDINGYSFVSTPSPAPGRDGDESPMMTWGEVESTPYRLDGSETPSRGTPGTIFRIPDVPRREKLGHSLAEKVGKRHRAKKQEALKKVTESLTSPSLKRMGSVDRMKMLSPAAQKLVNKSLGKRASTDAALRASYTPSPQHTPSSDKTPARLTPNRTPNKTPGKSGTTPKLPVIGSDISSLTDNLLNLPKRTNRPKATDFF
ncbi:splicing factor ESS-2 homolog [Glandiceps talaboti]